MDMQKDKSCTRVTDTFFKILPLSR